MSCLGVLLLSVMRCVYRSHPPAPRRSYLARERRAELKRELFGPNMPSVPSEVSPIGSQENHKIDPFEDAMPAGSSDSDEMTKEEEGLLLAPKGTTDSSP